MKKSILTFCAVILGAILASSAFATDSGKAIYESACSTCHGANGKGTLPGVPDFTKKGGVLSERDAVLIQRITAGYQSPGSPMAMPPKGGDSSLTGDQIEQVLSYLRSQFGS